MSEVAVIGGGAAGMIAAITAAERGHRVTLYEKNEKLGKKLYITGKGRCNVTNGGEMDKLFESVVSNPKFLYSAFYDFDNRQMMEFLEASGCRLKVERGERVFPVSDHSSDVISALEARARKAGVHIRLRTQVQEICCSEEEPGRVTGVMLRGEKEAQRADAVILATGGMSYPTTGSDGTGYLLAEHVGHTRKKCVPALVPLECKEAWCRSLQGLSLKNVDFTLRCGKKILYRDRGEMLFTHFGISGPLVLSASSYYAKCKDPSQVTGEIDLKPALTAEQLDKRILRDFQENNNKLFGNALGGLYPSRMIPVMIEQAQIAADKRVHEITKEERARLVECTKHLQMEITGTRDFTEAIITQGGINVKEVNPSTMESKLVKGLYLTGEMLDLDALTGGFNLQIAWSTGHLAGMSVE